MTSSITKDPVVNRLIRRVDPGDGPRCAEAEESATAAPVREPRCPGAIPGTATLARDRHGQ
jgi:hypothetical protein